MKRIAVFLLCLCPMVSCSPATPSEGQGTILVQYTPATTPWLADLYDCAGNAIVDANPRAADYLYLDETDLVLRLGEPAELSSPAYQIDSEQIQVILNPKNPVHTLTLEQARGLFSGQILDWKDLHGPDSSVQVWVYASGEDVQQVFDRTVLEGSPVTSMARLAMGPEEMRQAVADDVNAVGILTGRWSSEGVTNALTVANAPLLAIPSPQSQVEMDSILACLQK